ncbi:hypothetical protein FOMPIDRAFT_1056366 [Fomitopsis schrenkii]|uniref:Protein kinase domain-containing protein n=1 Tax=Fomitopsis schrenkii TaxID=2126942 RepID=S8DHH5_FOMSC|nr:hypothetical protein FOMPIDRAFT_1056366 [Fomitopsis schrenkii]
MSKEGGHFALNVADRRLSLLADILRKEALEKHVSERSRQEEPAQAQDVFALKAITKLDVLAHLKLQHTLRLAERAATEIVKGVEGFHVIYHDLKPQNILIAADGDTVLTDFGLSSREFPRRISPPTAPPTPPSLRGNLIASTPTAATHHWMKSEAAGSMKAAKRQSAQCQRGRKEKSGIPALDRDPTTRSTKRMMAVTSWRRTLPGVSTGFVPVRSLGRRRCGRRSRSMDVEYS